ncbi:MULTISPECIES: orange carotenoid protein N-terminal domain-containing protein [Trichocoleus]|uniref:Orange carotenoid protein n=1 Tax=Trichocoleus desertorum GB2-A4 TaxID=2933944 RepID=A0ABV0J9M5_9CYAN|nr:MULTISPECIES: orange carotenoid protein N-terminal domain-containing protein [unclassified Trichocoleus]MBD1862831.1 Orange carotenoid protein [Trichocoleus sp. FACHB-46]MBD2095004.1 Orange carotenoid protein [Trichocoleus sp. FACHB-591]MBD2124334.1 Orange carotenoid protein [Trichocoleus sp. FACHB-262]
MTFTKDETIRSNVEAFQSLDVDQQLALFYFIYKEMGGAITPAAPGASTVSPEIAEGLFNQVKDMSHEEQLQLQRDLITHKNGLLAREYGSIGDTTKLLFWYRLAQGMDAGIISPLPADYQLAPEAQSLLEQIKGLQFQQQITLFRDLVSPMGVDSATAEHDSETGL